MYVAFKLPQDESYGYVLNLIKIEIIDWATCPTIQAIEKEFA